MKLVNHYLNYVTFHTKDASGNFKIALIVGIHPYTTTKKTVFALLLFSSINTEVNCDILVKKMVNFNFLVAKYITLLMSNPQISRWIDPKNRPWAFSHLHGLIFKTSILYWQDQPDIKWFLSIPWKRISFSYIPLIYLVPFRNFASFYIISPTLLCCLNATPACRP